MVEVLSLLFEILAVVCCLHYLYGEKLRLDRVTVGFVVVEISYLLCVNKFATDNRWTLLMYPIVMIYCGVRFGFEIKSILVNNVLYMAMVSGVQATVAILVRWLIDLTNTKMYMMLLINCLTFCIVWFVLRKCKLKVLSEILQSKESLITISLTVMIIDTLLFLLNYKSSSGFEHLYYVVLVVCIILIILAALDIGKHKLEAREAEAELRLHRLYEASFKSLIEDICAKQHEFDNHINAIYNQHFLYDNYEELIKAQGKYCEAVIRENKYNKLLSKGNPIILGFLYGKFAEAEKQGLDITYKVVIENVECSVPVYKIIEILGNLIKNAMEALLESGLTGLHVLMIEEADLIRIEVSNEVEKFDYSEISRFFKKGYSKKGTGRGYGLYNVKKICEEYNVEIECSNRNDENENWIKFKLLMKKSL